MFHPPLFVEPPAFRWLADAATYGTLTLEAAIAGLYLFPWRVRLEPARHVLLLTFCLVTYAFAPVAGFGGPSGAEPLSRIVEARKGRQSVAPPVRSCEKIRSVARVIRPVRVARS